MTEPAKTFKVQCAHADCQKPFHVRFPLARPDATGTSEVVVTCLHCDKQVVIVIPRVYIESRRLSARADESSDAAVTPVAKL